MRSVALLVCSLRTVTREQFSRGSLLVECCCYCQSAASISELLQSAPSAAPIVADVWSFGHLFASQIVGTLSKEASEALGLPSDVIVSSGSGDNAMSALGVGCVVSMRDA